MNPQTILGLPAPLEGISMRSTQMERVICGWCHIEFDIDPALAAHLYQCPGCRERQVYGALKHANLDSNAVDLSHAFSSAAANNLHRFALAFTFLKEGKENVGSGTLVEIGGHFLIATAAHTIPIRADRIRIAPKLEMHEFDRHPDVLKLAKSNTLDVGLIEVEPDAARLLGMEAIQVDRIWDLRTGREGVALVADWLSSRQSATRSRCQCSSIRGQLILFRANRTDRLGRRATGGQ
jgi:hypothetical protein